MENTTNIDLHQLIVYTDILNNDTFSKLTAYFDTNSKSLFCEIYHELLGFAEKNNLKGSLLTNFITDLIIHNENIFSLFCEKHKSLPNGTLIQCVHHDIDLIHKLLNIDFNDSYYQRPSNLSFFDDYVPCSEGTYSSLNREAFYSLANYIKTSESSIAINELAKYYGRFGCGNIAGFTAFRWNDSKGPAGISSTDPITFDDLIGYEYQKEILIKNTEAFLNGKRANNVLLYGDRGTGKSSSVKALLNKFQGNNLKMIEITKHQLIQLDKILDFVENRGFFFILFLDDLSFEEFETEYKIMKALIDGSLKKKPDNLLIYATSNRRHLILERWNDKTENEELHAADSVQEKLSLADRFGITITFQNPDYSNYLKIVLELAKKSNIKIEEKKLIAEAKKWDMLYNGHSARSAKQFIDYISDLSQTD